MLDNEIELERGTKKVREQRKEERNFLIFGGPLQHSKPGVTYLGDASP